MARWWIGLGFGFSLLGALALSASCYATPQEPQTGAASEKSTDESGSSNGKVEKGGTPVQPAASWEERENSVGLHLLKNIAQDQKALWDGPKSLRWVDADWLVPLGGTTAALFATDTDFSRHLSNSPNRIKYSKDVSNYGIASLVGIGGGMYVLGHFTHDDHKMETGILAGEAAIDSLVPVEAMKYAFGRERPLQDNYQGKFFHSGVSFPSEHAAAAWSIASVIAHEYPGPLTSIFAYGLASAISVSRITAKQHFPSDVLVGSAIGWLEGMYVYRKHHDPRLGGGEWETYAEKQEGSERSTGNLGSPYVPLDSWIYPDLERLIAQGYINDAIVGMRPWTRIECARLVDEAQDRVYMDPGVSSQTEQLVELLAQEFTPERDSLAGGNNRQLRLESVYARLTEISGTPLTDGNHFGQTIINDFGRPYQEGFNSVDGFSAWTTSGRWVGYVSAEYQHSPSAPAQPDGARQFIASVDNIPGVPPAAPFSTVNRVRLLDAYVGMNFENWQVSFGKQSLWWGPIEGGPLMFSDNAEPVNMFRITSVSPFKLPGFLAWLGPIRTEWFLGQFSGHEFVFRTDTGIVGQFGHPIGRQPFLQGQKFSMKPTANFEFSVSTTAVFSGGPTPLTWHYFLYSYSLGNGSSSTSQQGSTSDPGDRRSGVDFSYKVPGMRNWLTFYGDAFTEDEFSPLGYPRKSAIRGGIYMPRIPGIPKLDLRLEGGSTVPPDFPGCFGCFYVNNRYPDGSYTNQGNLVGSWLGRAGQGEQAWTTYWLTSRNKIQLNYRHQKVSGQYLPRGGTVNDGGVRADFWLGTAVTFSGSVQYEKWNYPVLDPLPRSNVSTSIQLTYWPRSWK
jgi:hypothetical protein